jgi:pimeloyl-ACP methyl ester carboxylesterase
MRALHRLRVRAACSLLFAAALAAAGAAVQAQQPAATDPARYRPEAQTVVMQGGGVFGGDLRLVGTYWRPPQGEGPFPLVLLSHGSNADAAARQRFTLQGYWNTARWFLNRGFAVLYVLRPSYGASEGPYLEANAPQCDQANHGPGFAAMADVIAAMLAHAKALPQADATRIVLVGHSAGGAASVAMAARRPAGVVGFINFAGGKGGGEHTPYAPCRADDVERLFAGYARTSDMPSLWLYAPNDLYFGGPVAPRWHAAYQAAGGRAQLVLTAPAPQDRAGHHIVNQHLNLWSAAAEDWLRRLGFAWPR